MKNKTIEWFFDALVADNQCVLYSGNFNDDITDRVIQLAEHNFDIHNEKVKVKKRVSYLLAECFQNIIRHGKVDDSNGEQLQETGFFMTRNTAGKYYITSGNLIGRQYVEKLEGQLKQVNNLNQDELKLLYRKVITEGKISDKGGAGLGLIDMARKSGKKLGYKFQDFNDAYALFYNQILLDSAIEAEYSEQLVDNIEFAIELHNKMVQNNIILLQKGDFSRDSIIPILNIMENNVMSAIENSYLMKVIFHIMVELLQNIGRHGLEVDARKEGIFALSHKDGEYAITTGNYVASDKVEAFSQLLTQINRMTSDELKNAYIELLRNGDVTENGGAGIGLIDIARLASENFEYDFRSIDATKSFFIITVKNKPH
jgi:hypothetical protein